MENSDITKDLLLKLTHLMHDAEKELCIALPKMKTLATAADIKEFINEAVEEQFKQYERFEIILALLKENSEEMTQTATNNPNSGQPDLAESWGGDGLSDNTMITLQQTHILHLIEMNETAVLCATALGYAEITRILKRSLLAEKGMIQKLKLLKKVHTCNEAPQPC